MSELHVFGIGSPFGDDRLGWEVIDRLQHERVLTPYIPHRLQLIRCDRPGMQLLEMMKPAQAAWIVDAVKSGSAIGTLHVFHNEDIEQVDTRLTTHAFGVAEAIKMGKILNMLPLQVTFYGIEIGASALVFELSPPIIAAIDELARRLQQAIVQVMA